MKVEVMTRETIKPSHPTPHHLRHLALSFLDQIQLPNFEPIIFFYQSCLADHHYDRLRHLKKSLAMTLTIFYPLAGRLKNDDDLFIDCNDEGVQYLEAEVKCHLSQVLEQRNHEELLKLFPSDQLDDAKGLLLAIQVNIFDCGGMAIATCFSHKLADASSIFTFVNYWAAIARGEHKGTTTNSPKFDLALHFPPREDMSRYKRTTGGMNEIKLAAKSFVFSASAISALKAKYATYDSSKQATYSSSIEALTTFIFNRFVAATTNKGKADLERGYQVIQAVDLRKRMNPPLPDSYFGNLSRFVIVLPSMEQKQQGYGLVSEMRGAMRKVDVERLREGNLTLNPLQVFGDRIKEEMVPLSFSSLLSFPVYKADFGWGTPIWVTFPVVFFLNTIVFMPIRSANGIEVVIIMKEGDLAKLEADKEFLAFVSSKWAADVKFPSSL